MHIPDNYLSPATCAVMGAVMVPVWTRAVKKVKKEVTKKKMPLMGIGASLSFLIMMFNVPLTRRNYWSCSRRYFNSNYF